MPLILILLSLLPVAAGMLLTARMIPGGGDRRLWLLPCYWRRVLFVFIATSATLMLTETDFLAPLGFSPTRLAVTGIAALTFSLVATLLPLLRAGGRARTVAVLLLCLVPALFSESVICNLRAWETVSYTPVELTDTLVVTNVTGQPDEDGYYTMVHPSRTLFLYAHDLDAEIHNIYVEVDARLYGNTLASLSVTPSATDAGNENYLTCPGKLVHTGDTLSCYIPMNLSGSSSSLRLAVDGEFDTAQVRRVAINCPRPFQLSAQRFLWVFFLLLAAYALRPRSRLWATALGVPDARRIAGTALVAAGLLGLCCYLVIGRPGFGGLIASHQAQYQQLADAFLNGHLHLFRETPPDFLLEMENPYDTYLRIQLEQANGQYAYWDASFFNGNYYVYFGVLPVLLLYLPFRLLTGGDLPNDVAVLIFVAVLIAAGFWLVYELLRRFADPARISWLSYLLLSLITVGSGACLFLCSSPDMYTVPIAAGLAFATLGLALWLRAGREPANLRPMLLFFGSLCVAATAACRPQLLLVAFLAFPLFWSAMRHERTLFSRRGWRNTLAALLPFLMVALPLMWYNAARFGSPFDFGANYNLTTNDMTLRGYRVERIFPALWSYLIQLPKLSTGYPFIEAADISTVFRGVNVYEATYGGLFLVLPFSLYALGCLSRRRELLRRGSYPLTLALLGIGVFIALFDGQGAGILQRYFADFAMLILLSAALVFAARESRLRGPALRAHRRNLVLLGAAGFIYHLFLYWNAHARLATLIQFWD